MAQGVVLFNYEVDPSSAEKRVNKSLRPILVDGLAKKLAPSRPTKTPLKLSSKKILGISPGCLAIERRTSVPPKKANAS